MLAIQRDLTRSFFVLLSLPATAMGFALSVQISALSWILTTKYGLDIHDVGLVWAAGPIAGILGQVIIGVVSDRVWFWNGRRRPFILIGGVLASLMLLALPNIDVISGAMGLEGILGVAIVVALTLDLAINVSFNPTRSIIADVTPEGINRTRGYTWMQTISGSFGVMAYAIGAIWSNYALIYVGAILVLVFSILPPLLVEEPRVLGEPEETGASHGGLRQMLVSIRPLWGFLVYDAYALGLRLSGIEVDHYYAEIACLLLTAWLVGSTLFKAEDDAATDTTDHVGFQKVLAAHSFSWIGVQTMFIYMLAWVQQKMPGLSDVDSGRVISISFLVLNAVAAVLPAFVLEPITERIGRVRTHMLCCAVMAFGYLGITLSGQSTWMLYVLMAVCGVGWAAIVSLPFAIMSQKVEQSRMGLYMGLFNLSVVLPQLLASLGVGLFVSRVADKSAIFMIAAVSLALSAACWSLVKEGRGTLRQDAPGGAGH
jgi:MFS family permease